MNRCAGKHGKRNGDETHRFSAAGVQSQTQQAQQELRDGLSVVVQIDNTLWVANDETASLERLSHVNSNRNGVHRYGKHTQNDFLRLPVPPPSNAEKDEIDEVDVEGLDYSDGYLWVVGSHSLKRQKPHEDDPGHKNIKRLAKVSTDGNRFLLGRIPLEKETWTLAKAVKQDGKKLAAARLHGNHKGNDLTREVAADKHLRDFLALPGKENGFDIEGLAVVGKRLFVGLRGPVLRGWAVILEMKIKQDDASTLKLKRIGPHNQRYRRHFLDLRGLGIRNLCVHKDDLLILAPPTADLDGPVTVFRWPGGTKPEDESLVFAKDLPAILDIPFRKKETMPRAWLSLRRMAVKPARYWSCTTRHPSIVKRASKPSRPTSSTCPDEVARSKNLGRYHRFCAMRTERESS